jgi:sugar phosphate isomerase/epimerase
MIYVSSGGFPHKTALETAEFFLASGISSVELSGGLPDQGQLANLKLLKNLFNFQVHNYFPPPSTPFVFNLASQDYSISTQSYKHVVTAMQLSVDLNRPVYSFHAGFLVDPKVTELGKTIRGCNVLPREKGLELFLDRVNKLAIVAEKLGVSLLIENNVLSLRNYQEFGCDPFLMTTSEECVYVMENTPSNVNMLVDVAHLKVSANSLLFNPIDFLEECNSWIRAYHLSDNDGTRDSNQMVDEGSWFWNYLRRDLDYYSLEIYGVGVEELLSQIEITTTKLQDSLLDYLPDRK